MTKLKYLLFAIICFSAVGEISAQCRTYAQKNCLPELGEYKPNGSLYSTYMENGQETEINMVLIGGQKYRLLHCHKKGLGNVWIQLYDNNNKLVYDNSEHDFATTWDFNVKVTQEFKLKTFVSGIDESQSTTRSCAVMMLGNKFN